MKAKLKEVKEDFYAFSGKASEISRQLGLAGIAIIWLFKTGDGEHVKVGTDAINILQWLVVSLMLDFAHAAVPSLIYGWLDTSYRRNGKTDGDAVEYSLWYAVPEWIFFVAKIVVLVIAYIKLWHYITGKLV